MDPKKREKNFGNKMLHYSMFAPNSQIAKDNASHAFGIPIGTEMYLSDPITLPADVAKAIRDTGRDIQSVQLLDDTITPGILANTTFLTIGSTADGFEAPINKACRALYAKYWKANSSISAFQEMDIGIYTFCSAQLVGCLSWLRAIYAALHLNSTENQYIRSGLLRALGVNPRGFDRHVNDLLGYYNQKVIDLAGFAMDDSVPLYRYAESMYDHLYKDAAATDKTQYYVTRPAYLLKYVKSGEDIGSITYRRVLFGDDQNRDGLTYEQLCDLIDEVFAAFVSSKYIGNISAAILKAFDNHGGTKYTVSTMSDSFRIEPAYNEFALTRLKNATYFPFAPGNITQDPVALTLSQRIGTEFNGDAVEAIKYGVALTEAPIVHACKPEDATPENVIVFASLTDKFEATAEYIGSDIRISFDAKYYGYEMCCTFEVYHFNASRELLKTDGDNVAMLVTDQAPYGQELNANVLYLLKAAKDFDFYPNLRVYAVAAIGDSLVSYNVQRLGLNDADYSSVFASGDLFKLHRASIQTILGVPETL